MMDSKRNIGREQEREIVNIEDLMVQSKRLSNDQHLNVCKTSKTFVVLEKHSYLGGGMLRFQNSWSDYGN